LKGLIGQIKGLIVKIIEVWRPIKDLIADSQDQEPTRKWRVISGVEIA
jgi:hypothetical protein